MSENMTAQHTQDWVRARLRAIFAPAIPAENMVADITGRIEQLFRPYMQQSFARQGQGQQCGFQQQAMIANYPYKTPRQEG